MFLIFARVTLRGVLSTVTGLHIGRGGSLDPVGTDNPVIRDQRGCPMIPGSSFKGALRARVESLLRAIDPALACDPLDEGRRCVTKEQVEEIRKNHASADFDRELTNFLKQKTCRACLLFGSPWMASKVQVRDLLLVPEQLQDGEWLGQFEVRDGVAIDRDSQTAASGRKYDFEVVPSGTTFGLELVVENPDDLDLGILYLGLRELAQGQALLGGITSRGLGRVSIDWKELELVDQTNLVDYLLDGRGRVVEGDEAVWSHLASQWEKLREPGALVAKLKERRHV